MKVEEDYEGNEDIWGLWVRYGRIVSFKYIHRLFCLSGFTLLRIAKGKSEFVAAQNRI